MSQSQIRTYKLVEPRPWEAPDGWTIWNAPRPIRGTVEWQHYYMEGWFCAAVDPRDPNLEFIVEFNVRMDACKIEFITQEQLDAEIREWAVQQWWYEPNLPWQDIVDTWEMNFGRSTSQ